jgi:hypothetical protein
MQKTILFFIFSLSIISYLSFSNAQEGCCFNPTNGLCSLNSESSSCVSPGEFFSSTTCDVDACAMGCCSLGTFTEYTTSRQCYLESTARGFDPSTNFNLGFNQEECSFLARQLEVGACLLGDYPPYECSIKTRAECQTDRFYENTTCTNTLLNTTCNITTNTMCNNGNVYTRDSCLNPDQLVSECSYQNSLICSVQNSTYAYCKSLDCSNGKKNGERWCNHSESPINPGDRFFSQYCLNGNIYTEPCADFRMDYCLDSPFKDVFGDQREVPFTNGACEQNPWEKCIQANSEVLGGPSSQGSNQGSILAGEERISKLEESCEEDFCNIFEPEMTSSEKDKLKEFSESTNYDYAGLKEDSTELLKSLGLEICFPKIQPGLELSSKAATTKDSLCSLGNYQTNVVFRKDCDDTKFGILSLWTIDVFCHWGLDIEDPTGNSEVNTKLMQYEAMTTGTTYQWQDWEQIFICKNGNKYCDLADNDASVLPVNPSVLAALSARCNALGDCGGKVNWIGNSGSSLSSESNMFLAKDEGWKKTYTFTYQCLPWKAPSSGDDCQECGKDGLPCSEYRCKSLGKKCQFYEPSGIDSGVCISSDDKSSPIINLKNITPPSPIQPYTPVDIVITTDEMSECKFNIGQAGAKFSEMQYDFSDGFGLEHSVRLALPGQIQGFLGNITQYPLISRDGNYTMYVRCLDGAGNGETMVAYPINFEIMKTPDVNILGIAQFIPTSGSLITFNTTQKDIRFKTLEPMQCRWGLQDKNFSLMENEFSCDSVGNPQAINGYFCAGTLYNVTLELGQQTSFFIRCKDQPWMENDSIIVNGVEYHRNTHSQSFEYKLGPSPKLNILEISPGGLKQIGATNATFEVKAATSQGSSNGLATCYWKIINYNSTGYSPWTIFSSTNNANRRHASIITNPYLIIGENILQVRCNDSSGNVEYLNSSFNLQIDTQTPIINRIYSQNNNLKIKTDEPAVCYFSLDNLLGCTYNILNGTLMSGVEKEHITPWSAYKKYYIKCRDYFGNSNTDVCGGIISTYQ